MTKVRLFENNSWWDYSEGMKLISTFPSFYLFEKRKFNNWVNYLIVISACILNQLKCKFLYYILYNLILIGLMFQSKSWFNLNRPKLRFSLTITCAFVHDYLILCFIINE